MGRFASLFLFWNSEQMSTIKRTLKQLLERLRGRLLTLLDWLITRLLELRDWLGNHIETDFMLYRHSRLEQDRHSRKSRK